MDDTANLDDVRLRQVRRALRENAFESAAIAAAAGDGT
jgi:hypothetical protein